MRIIIGTRTRSKAETGIVRVSEKKKHFTSPGSQRKSRKKGRWKGLQMAYNPDPFRTLEKALQLTRLLLAHWLPNSCSLPSKPSNLLSNLNWLGSFFGIHLCLCYAFFDFLYCRKPPDWMESSLHFLHKTQTHIAPAGCFKL